MYLVSENITSDGTPKLNQEKKAKNYRKLKDKIIILECIIRKYNISIKDILFWVEAWSLGGQRMCTVIVYQLFTNLNSSLHFLNKKFIYFHKCLKKILQNNIRGPLDHLWSLV